MCTYFVHILYTCVHICTYLYTCVHILYTFCTHVYIFAHMWTYFVHMCTYLVHILATCAHILYTFWPLGLKSPQTKSNKGFARPGFYFWVFFNHIQLPRAHRIEKTTKGASPYFVHILATCSVHILYTFWPHVYIFWPHVYIFCIHFCDWHEKVRKPSQTRGLLGLVSGFGFFLNHIQLPRAHRIEKTTKGASPLLGKNNDFVI